MKQTKRDFSDILLGWYKTQDRPMPWKGIKNPYFIWLSEIILQQTRVEQGLPYYKHFIKKYPTVFDLANAPEDQVMKSWEGLGYYSRARNLHAAAKQIAFEFDGHFPETYESIRSLKGVGPYTAAAISSFAFGLPHAVVDGNVYRVLSRIFGIKTPIDSTAGKKEFTVLAEQLLEPKQAGKYNQAIMDFGATLCLPKLPKCVSCPFENSCIAKKENQINQLPVKAKKLKKKTRFFNYLILKNKQELLIRKRSEKDIWLNLYEFPMIESEQFLNQTALEHALKEKGWLGEKAKLIKNSKAFNQALTHQKINARFWEYETSGFKIDKKNAFIITNLDKLRTFAFPKIIDQYLSQNEAELSLFGLW